MTCRVVARYFGGWAQYPAVIVGINVLDENFEGGALDQVDATLELLYGTMLGVE